MLSRSKEWSLQSWRSYPIKQQPQYEDLAELENVLDEVRKLPPLVFAGEIDRLRQQLSAASRGEAFVLQGGDCAERFQDCNKEAITSKLKIILQMSVVLCYGLRKPVVRIGRIAGQYAKPRSQDHEWVDGQEIPVYRGDIINSFEATVAARRPDPKRIKQAHLFASSTLNYVRALTKGGFADLHQPQNWDLSFVDKAPKRLEYKQIVANIRDAIVFMEALGSRQDNLRSVEFYTSHEGLLLPLEESLTHFSPEQNRWYNLGAHMLWIGDRTRQLNGAHIEYFRGIANPIGVKVGPNSSPREILEICQRLNPSHEEGKITLITRFGHGKVKQFLPALVEAIRDANCPVLYSVDPMHGNGIKTEGGVKTRDFDAILGEIKETHAELETLQTKLGGIHFELTGQDVTECIGGSAAITPEHLDTNYETYCDPRLNYSQSLEMAFLISNILGVSYH